MEIGITLKNARDSKGVSLEMAEEKTKIRKKYLKALESESFDLLPGEVYVRGFLRNYARFLGIDGEELVNQYNDYIASLKSNEEKEDEERAGYEEGFLKKKRNILLVIGGFFLVAILIAFFMGIFNNNDNNNNSVQGNERIENRNDSPVNKSDNSQEEKNKEKEYNLITNGEEKTIEVVLNARSRSWILVNVNEDKVYEGFLNNGEEMEFTGEKVYLRIGNAGAVNVKVNNEEKGYLGEEGQVEERTYSVENFGESL